MGLGNGNPKSGDKGSNFNFEVKMLQGLEAIANALDGGGGSGDPTLSPGPAFLSGVFDASQIVTFSDTNIANKGFSGTFQKVGNVVTTDISLNVDKLTSATGTIELVLPLQVVGNIASNASFITGTMSVSDKIIELLLSYTFVATSTSTVAFNYVIDPTSIDETYIRLHVSYVYNTNIAVVEMAPIIL